MMEAFRGELGHGTRGKEEREGRGREKEGERKGGGNDLVIGFPVEGKGITLKSVK
jgi:hypothetical protein